ncbi:MAG: 50S ribosomal protein L29 [Patescibacteria group bacterium]|jgi:ribosomal protein L29
MKQKESLKQLKVLDSKSLIKELAASNHKLVELRFGAKLKKLKNFKEISLERKKIARIWTLLGEKVSADLVSTSAKEVKNVR